MKTKQTLALIVATIILGFGLICIFGNQTFAEETVGKKVKNTAKEIGTGTKNVVREIKKGVKAGSKEVGHTFRKAGKEIKHQVVD